MLRLNSVKLKCVISGTQDAEMFGGAHRCVFHEFSSSDKIIKNFHKKSIPVFLLKTFRKLQDIMASSQKLGEFNLILLYFVTFSTDEFLERCIFVQSGRKASADDGRQRDSRH